MKKRNPKTRFQREKAEAGERRCIVSGEPLPREEMIRFVLGPDNQVYPDLADKLDGRGVWVCAKKSALQTAIDKRLFNKGFGHAVIVPQDLMIMTENGLKKRILNLLGLANKSGFVEMGFEKIKEASTKEEMILLIEASDGSIAERERLQQYLPDVPVMSLLTREELGFEMGRDFCVHLAIKKSKMTINLKNEWMRAHTFLNEGKDNE